MSYAGLNIRSGRWWALVVGFILTITCVVAYGLNKSEEFVGITTDGKVVEELFELHGKGSDTAPIKEAALSLIQSFSEEDRTSLVFSIESEEWRHWANIHRFDRQGISLKEMNRDQREEAFGLLRASLSAQGYNTATDIIKLNQHLAELINNFDEYGEDLYWFSLMGEPSATEPWGWQLDGHHLVINYLVLGDQVVMTPTFMGSEPVTASSGQYQGIQVLQEEQNHGLAFMKSLPVAQQQRATIERKSSSNLKAAMDSDNLIIPFEGLPVSEMKPEAQQSLLQLVALYVDKQLPEHAKIRMDQVKQHLSETYFAWAGEIHEDAVFYYRIHSPVILVEFDHQGTVALEGSWGQPTRRHIHTVVRTPNGNDYGKDLLRQHYQKHADNPEHGHSH